MALVLEIKTGEAIIVSPSTEPLIIRVENATGQRAKLVFVGTTPIERVDKTEADAIDFGQTMTVTTARDGSGCQGHPPANDPQDPQSCKEARPG